MSRSLIVAASVTWVGCSSTTDPVAKPVDSGVEGSDGVDGGDGGGADGGSDTDPSTDDRIGDILDLPSGTWLDVAVGDVHACAVHTGGSLACWGTDTAGQLSPPEGEFAAVTVGTSHGCALDMVGEIACWGDNSVGQSSPPEGPWVKVESGLSHTCAVDASGAGACWGSDLAGQATVPDEVFVEISTGAYHTCGLTIEGQLSCWGHFEAYPDDTWRPSGTIADIDLGYEHTAVRFHDNVVQCFGFLGEGRCPEEGGTLPFFDAGGHLSCALYTDGSKGCWPNHDDDPPVEGPFVDVNAGRQDHCAIREDGSMTCWNSYGDRADSPLE